MGRLQLLLYCWCLVLASAGWDASASRPANLAGNYSPYTVFGRTYEVLPNNENYLEVGVASWYGQKFHGRTTANGEVYDMYRLSAAHKSLRLPAWVRVTNLDSGSSLLVRVNDRGPFHDERLIDLSYAAARALGFAKKGTAPVVVESIYPVATGVIPERPGSGPYYLQLGAFTQRARAESLRNRMLELMRLGLDERLQVEVLTTDRQDVILNKVWLGPFVDVAARESLVELIRAAGIGSPIRIDVK